MQTNHIVTTLCTLLAINTSFATNTYTTADQFNDYIDHFSVSVSGSNMMSTIRSEYKAVQHTYKWPIPQSTECFECSLSSYRGSVHFNPNLNISLEYDQYHTHGRNGRDVYVQQKLFNDTTIDVNTLFLGVNTSYTNEYMSGINLNAGIGLGYITHVDFQYVWRDGRATDHNGKRLYDHLTYEEQGNLDLRTRRVATYLHQSSFPLSMHAGLRTDTQHQLEVCLLKQVLKLKASFQ